LQEGIKIIKMPGKFVQYLENNYPDTLPTILSDAKWAIDIEVEQIDTTNMTADEMISIGFQKEDNAINQLVDLITALRLLQKGRIVAGLLISATLDDSEWIIGGSTTWTPMSNILFFEEEPSYNLRQSEVQKLITLFLRIRQCRAANILKNIEISLERFHSSYHGNIEDRIIDQMIAFESLYLGNEQELTYRLALRVAFLLCKRKDSRHKVFTDIKKAYGYRSRIVHGVNPPRRNELKPFVTKTEDYLRQSIKKFLLLFLKGNSLKDIRERLLDKNILYNGDILITE
jgi:hypothetical protein